MIKKVTRILCIITLLLQISFIMKGQSTGVYELKADIFIDGNIEPFADGFLRNYNYHSTEFSLTFGIIKYQDKPFSVGFDLNYSLSKEKYKPTFKIPKRVDIPNSGYFSVSDFYVFKESIKTYSPIVYLRYNNNISKRIDFALDLYGIYDFVFFKEKDIRYYPDSEMFFSDSPYIDYLKSTDISKSNEHYFNIGLRSILKFNLTERLGLSLTFGSIEFNTQIHSSKTKVKLLDNNNFNFNLKPKNWMLGFYLKM